MTNGWYIHTLVPGKQLAMGDNLEATEGNNYKRRVEWKKTNRKRKGCARFFCGRGRAVCEIGSPTEREILNMPTDNTPYSTEYTAPAQPRRVGREEINR